MHAGRVGGEGGRGVAGEWDEREESGGLEQEEGTERKKESS